MEWLLLVAGAILGVAFERIYSFSSKKIKDKYQNHKQSFYSDKVNPASVNHLLSQYYKNGDLHHCIIGKTERVIPFFVNDNWIFNAPIKDITDIIKYTETDDVKFQISDNLIEERIKKGQNVFNNPAIYTVEIINTEKFPEIVISKTEYFKLITNLIQLEEETFNCILNNKTDFQLRDLHFPDLKNVSKMSLKPLSFGISVGFVFNEKNKREIIIQTRSKETVTSGKSKAVFPCFGLEPIDETTNKNSMDLFLSNFIKEYLEEFFDYEELIARQRSKRPNPKWYMSLPEASELLTCLKNKKLAFSILGFGVDAVSGTTTLSVIAELSDTNLKNTIIDNIVGNWEVADAEPSIQPIEIVDIYSTKLESYLKNNELNYSSAFTIERIQKYYKNDC